MHKYCGDKRIYDKKGAITAKNKRFKEDHIVLRVYPCHNHWHLTKLISHSQKRRFKED